MRDTEEMALGGWRSAGRLGRPVCAAVVGVAVVVAVVAGWRWPLVGDASLMHYAVFLIRGGMVPYRDLTEVDLPGGFLAEAAAMRIFGGEAVGWRAYDLALLVLTAAAMAMVAGRRRWFAAVFAGGLFALAHLQDGIAQGGQRDLLMATLLVWSYVALLQALGGWRRGWMVLLAGLAIGATGTIKPMLLPLGVGMVLLAGVVLRRGRVLLVGVAGLVTPLVVMGILLLRQGALGAFWHGALPLMRWHAAMGRRGAGYLTVHALSPVGVLVVPWLVWVAIARPRWTVERVALVTGVIGAGLEYALQGKGYSYHRYPLLGMVLLLIGLDVDTGMRMAGWRRGLAMATAGVGCLVLAPRMAWLTTTFSPATPFQDALRTELGQMGGAAALTGKVQCLDTFGGCAGVLYDLRVRQSTGFLYQCYLFSDGGSGEGGGSGERDGGEVRERYRAAFWRAFQMSAPRVVVVTDQTCFGDARGFGKVAEWPEFADELARRYDERAAWRSGVPQHWWSRREQPAAFRIYVRRSSARQGAGDGRGG